MRGSARINDLRMAQFDLKIEKLSHIMGPRRSQDLRSPYLIMAPAVTYILSTVFWLKFFHTVETELGYKIIWFYQLG